MGWSRVCRLWDRSDRLSDYEEVWREQKRLVSERLEHRTQRRASAAHDALLVRHPPVYTLGAGSSLANLKFDVADPPFPIHRTERGGEVTYHGPGQLVLYPIIDLDALGMKDLRRYTTALESAAIACLADCGVEGRRMAGAPGVYVGDATARGGVRKVASLGIRCRRWVTFHGIALNVLPVHEGNAHITACGLEGVGVTSVAEERGEAHIIGAPEGDAARQALIATVADALATQFGRALDLELEGRE